MSRSHSSHYYQELIEPVELAREHVTAIDGEIQTRRLDVVFSNYQIWHCVGKNVVSSSILVVYNKTLHECCMCAVLNPLYLFGGIRCQIFRP